MKIQYHSLSTNVAAQRGGPPLPLPLAPRCPPAAPAAAPRALLPAGRPPRASLVWPMAEFREPQPRTPAKRAHWSRGCHHHVHQQHLASVGRLRGQPSKLFYPAASPRAQKMGTGYLAHPQTHKTHLDPRLGAGRLRFNLTCPCSCAGQVPVPRGPRSGVSVALRTPGAKASPSLLRREGPSPPHPPRRSQAGSFLWSRELQPQWYSWSLSPVRVTGKQRPRHGHAGEGPWPLELVSGCRPESLPQPGPKPGLSLHTVACCEP